MVKSTRLLCLLTVLGALGGCAQVYVPVTESRPVPTNSPSTFPPPQPEQTTSAPVEPQPAPAPDTEPEPQRIEPTVTAPVSGNGAVQSLLEDARRLSRTGEYDRSNAVAERAMRIDHAEPEVYLVMASNYLAMTQLQLAEQLVRQGLPLAGQRPAVKRQLEALLSRIRAER